MKIFKLPDLGEGLQEAEIVTWHVKPGDRVVADQPLVSVETAKALVDVPAPCAGRITKLFGEPRGVVKTGAPLVAYEDGANDNANGANDTRPVDSGTVVGEVHVGKEVVADRPAVVGRAVAGAGIKAIPAVRALAHRLQIDLTMVTPTGAGGNITANDVQRVAKILAEAGPQEILRGVRRAMADNMALAHGEAVPATLMDDADIGDWADRDDVTVRLMRAIVRACAAEPALNAWYDSQAVGRRLLKKIDLGIAVDTDDGLFVPVMRDIGNRTADDLRASLDLLKTDMRGRKVAPEDLRGNTITLSNFGMIAGRYAAPVVLPPTVAILGAGRARAEVVAYRGAPAVRRTLPLSLTFDHRAVTGGEAGRFMAAVIADLALAD